MTFDVFPIKAGAKSPPLVKDWPSQAKPRDQWPDIYGECSWGIHCKGMVVVDVDPKNGGPATFAKLDVFRGFPETRTVTTPSGGKHLYYALPEDHPGVPNTAGKLGPGIDTRSRGGYVLAPGSIVEGRGEYVLSEDRPIARAPEWLLEALGEAVPEAPKKATAPVLEPAPDQLVEQAREWIKARPVGGGTSYATACGLRDRGLSREQAEMVFAEHDPRPDAVEQVAHAYRYAKGEPGGVVGLPSDFDDDVTPTPPPAPKPVGAAITFSELSNDSRPGKGYLIKGLLQRGTHAVAYGPPGAGKTFVALDLAFHVAAGKEWMGRRVRQGAVLYLAYEGMGGLAKRVRAIRQHYGRDSVPLYFHAADFNLREKEGRKQLGALLASLPETPSLIVVDTLARAMRGGDENSAQDMGALNDAVGALIENTGACVLLLHHSGKNAANGARGSSALLGAVDTEINIDERVITATKQRDIEAGAPIGFRLDPIMVGIDEDGDEIMSCVVQEAAVTSGPKLTRAQRTALDLIREYGPLDSAQLKGYDCPDAKNVGNSLIKAGLARRTQDRKYELLSG